VACILPGAETPGASVPPGDDVIWDAWEAPVSMDAGAVGAAPIRGVKLVPVAGTPVPAAGNAICEETSELEINGNVLTVGKGDWSDTSVAPQCAVANGNDCALPMVSGTAAPFCANGKASGVVVAATEAAVAMGGAGFASTPVLTLAGDRPGPTGGMLEGEAAAGEVAAATGATVEETSAAFAGKPVPTFAGDCPGPAGGTLHGAAATGGVSTIPNKSDSTGAAEAGAAAATAVT